MRILFLSTWFPYPPSNGSRLRVNYLLRALARDHAVTAAAFRWGESPNPGAGDGPPPGVEVHAVDVDPFRYVSLPAMVKFVSPLPLAYWPSRAMHRKLGALRTSGHWDAVIAYAAPVAQYALSLPIPRILEVDAALSYQMRERFMQGGHLAARLRALVSWRKAYWYESFLVRRFSAATVVSGRESGCVRSMVSTAPCRVEVIPNGVDCTHNRPGLAERQPHRLVYNGALSYDANYDAMVYFLSEIYPLIKRDIPDVSLTITGSTTGVDLNGLALDDTVTLTGYVNDVRIPVSEAAVCVVPLRRGGGTRLKILEAMALGTPVVATSKGAEGLDVVDGKDLLIADTPASFAEKTAWLIRDIEFQRYLAANARMVVETRYDWGQIGRQFVRLVEETVDTHRNSESQR
ncbi:MAG: glycosyltransferase [Anaerolineales bacterium]|nr:glycosyltransferase [Anaerolineales bacterium]